MNAGKLVLSPTRTYAPVIKQILDKYRYQIHGMIHCSGGAQTKVMNFVENMHIVKDNLFPVPPLFRLIQGTIGYALGGNVQSVQHGSSYGSLCRRGIGRRNYRYLKEFQYRCPNRRSLLRQ